MAEYNIYYGDKIVKQTMLAEAAWTFYTYLRACVQLFGGETAITHNPTGELLAYSNGE